ncbi:MAG TPA: AAA family ATPase [Acidimicrobiales bacterium]
MAALGADGVDRVRFGDAEVDVRLVEVRRGGEPQPVEPQVFDVLVHLIRHRDRVVSKEELLDEVWGDRFVSESALTSRIKAARQALGDNGRDQRIIRTVHGRGYRFVAEVEPEAAAGTVPAPAGAPAPLVEREADLAALAAAFAAAAQDPPGRVALVGGEAGIGKTSLVRAFLAGPGRAGRVLVGASDDLVTPRSLGPFHDMAPAGTAMAAALAANDREALLRAIAAELVTGDRPAVMVLEDVQWADDATLDVLRWFVRRVADHRCLLVLTYRSTEVDPGHPFHRVLGAVPAGLATRIDLAPLDEHAIAGLVRSAGRDLDPGELARASGGNPFFVTEVLADPAAGIPASVVDAVLARLHALPVSTRRALETCSVIPGSIDFALATALLGDVHVLDEAERRGMVVAGGDGIRFRHELARRAVEGSLTDLLRFAYHREVLGHLLALDAPASDLVHHAAAARDADHVVRHGTRAAEEAAAAGAHRQAADHFALVLAHADRIEPREAARLRIAHAYECYLVSDLVRAEAEAAEAVRAAEALGDDLLTAEALTTLSRILHWWDGASHDAGLRAIRLLGDDPPPELEAAACINLASDLVLAERHREAESWTDRGLAAAVRAGRKDLETLGLVYRATSRAWLGVADSDAELAAAVERAETLGAWEYAARGCINMVGMLFRQGRLAEAAPWIERAVADAEEGEFDMGLGRARSLRAGHRMYTGRWDEAEADLHLLTSEDSPGGVSWLPLALLGRLLARRGDRGAAAMLDRAAETVARSDDPQRSLNVAAARVEHAWLAGDDAAVCRLGTEALAEAGGLHYPQLRGEILRYVRRSGGPADEFEGCPLPYALGLRGDHTGAAELWAMLGFPFEQALELAESVTPGALAEAVAALIDLGAVTAVDRVCRGRG